MLIRDNILNPDNIGYYYIIIAHKNIVQASYKSLQKDLIVCFNKIKKPQLRYLQLYYLR